MGLSLIKAHICVAIAVLDIDNHVTDDIYARSVAEELLVCQIRSVLASMGFKQNDIGKSLSVLSGGEIIKLLLAKMLMGRYNILLMDEPSNFLDIPSLEALEILMKEYAGTIVFITHDKRLLENVADVVYEIRDKKINLKH